jgi:acetyl-CoA decarbonylase/synthase complex subunit gamma
MSSFMKVQFKGISAQPCCTPKPSSLGVIDAPWGDGVVGTPVGDVPRVRTRLLTGDRWGSFKARLGVGRMRYTVEPGLYAVGSPDADSQVFVSANYKMSFDRLRMELGGMHAWLLVLDTNGINVWCAAGKGTFCTAEIVARAAASGLDRIVNHRKLIIPQLGAPGVSAHEVKRQSGFRVVYGPVRAEDIPEFVSSGMRATPEMRRVRFPLLDRTVLIPMELVLGAKWAAVATAAMFVLSGLGEGIFSSGRMLASGPVNSAAFASSYVLATSLGPALLPWLPGRSFSVKGFWLGVAIVAALIATSAGVVEIMDNKLAMAAWALIVTAVSSHMVMNFTGSSTYTSLSGVMKEMKVAVPIQVVAAVAGAALWIGARFV